MVTHTPAVFDYGPDISKEPKRCWISNFPARCFRAENSKLIGNVENFVPFKGIRTLII